MPEGTERSEFTIRGTRWALELAHGSESERRAAEQIRRILKRHDLARWTFMRTVRIQDGAIPHSHPVLTLNTRNPDRDDIVLAGFIHEQIHWFLEERAEAALGAIDELRASYPRVPSSPPEGARNQFSTYLHLVVNALEYTALRDVLGPAEADSVMKIQAKRIYRWIYRTVLADFDRIHTVLERHGLLIS